MQEQEALLILNHIDRLGAVKQKRLIDYFGSAVEALEGSAEQMMEIKGFNDALAQAILRWREISSWQQDLELVEKQGVALISYRDPLYPQLLWQINDPPLLLYVKGELLKEDNEGLAVIGTRNASIYGREMAHKLSSELAGSGFTIVSGLARGIDTSAHQGALQAGGRTIAIIGSGLSNVYPQENRKLAELVAQNGAVISELPMLTPPERFNFPKRNRIVSGMSLAALLIEASLHSGAMRTMQLAESQGRQLFAISGRIDMGTFKGNHDLIKRGVAKLIEDSRDVAACFSCRTPKNSNLTASSLPLLELEEESLLNQMPEREIFIEELLSLTQFSMTKINILMMSLMFKKMVKEFPGKIYKKIAAPSFENKHSIEKKEVI